MIKTEQDRSLRAFRHAYRETAAPKHGPDIGTASLPIVGRWQLVHLAGTGSWSHVYRARPAELPEDRLASYAIKIVSPGRQNDTFANRLLAREAVVGRRVSNPHVVSVLEAELDSGSKSGQNFIVMPWLEGNSLEQWLDAGRTFELPVILWIARQAAQGLAALDAAGYTHGDIKPSNMFFDARGHVTLLDVAFARRRDETIDSALPRDRAIMGTGHYLAPEHFLAHAPQLSPDIRSDIYSLGVVMYRLLTGELPIDGRTLEEVARAHKQRAPRSIRSLTPHVPGNVAALVQSMLAKDPLRRPQSTEELIQSLVRLEIQTFNERAA